MMCQDGKKWTLILSREINQGDLFPVVWWGDAESLHKPLQMSGFSIQGLLAFEPMLRRTAFAELTRKPAPRPDLGLSKPQLDRFNCSLAARDRPTPGTFLK
jgi:hypothetical protein